MFLAGYVSIRTIPQEEPGKPTARSVQGESSAVVVCGCYG